MAILHTSMIVLRVFAAAVVAVLLMAVHAEARINKVVPGHVGLAFRTLAVSSSYLFPLQSGLNKVTIQGDAAMLNVKSVTLSHKLKASIKIVGRGAKYLHLNITIAKGARVGKTGDGILNQRIRKGTPDKWRWKIYERGTALSIVGPASVQVGSERRITFRGSQLGSARLIAQPQKWTIVNRVSRNSTRLVYTIRFDKCNGARVNFNSNMLVNETLPPNFQKNLQFAHYYGKQNMVVSTAGPNCSRPRVRPGAISGGCAVGFRWDAAARRCVRR